MAETIDGNLRVRPLDTVYVREVDDEAIVLNMETEQYVGFDPMARSMWEALTTCSTVAEAIERLADEYEVDRAQLDADVAAFVATLQANDLVSIEPAS
jgi:Coenzyme PQQ synthesis protein D (PqqD)